MKYAVAPSENSPHGDSQLPVVPFARSLVVPASVPSVVHSDPSSNVPNTTRDPTRAAPVGREPSGRRLTSAISSVPAGVPSVRHSSPPAAAAES